MIHFEYRTTNNEQQQQRKIANIFNQNILYEKSN